MCQGSQSKKGVKVVRRGVKVVINMKSAKVVTVCQGSQRDVKVVKFDGDVSR